MKKFFAPFVLAAALCASAQEAPAPSGDVLAEAGARTAEATALLKEAVKTAPAAKPDLTVRLKSLDALREAITSSATLAGQPQFGLMGTMGLASVLNEAGLSAIRPGDPAYVWVWDFAGLVESEGDDTPVILAAVPVEAPAAALDEALERMEDASGAPVEPAIWTDDDDLFVTGRDGWTLAASDPALFDRAKDLLAVPAALPEATLSVSSETVQSFLPAILDAADADGDPLEELAEAVSDGAPDWAEPLVAFMRDVQALGREGSRDYASFRLGIRSDYSNGVVFAMSAAAAPGTRTAEQFAAVKTPLAPDALAGVPASAFFWAAVADVTENPKGVDNAKIVESARKNLLPLVKDEARRARLDGLFARATGSTKNVRACTLFAAADGEGRPYAKSVETVVSPERTREDLHAFGDAARAELAAFPELASLVDVPEGALSATVRVGPLATAVVEAASAKLVEDAGVPAEAAEAGKDDVLASRAQILAKLFGDEFRVGVEIDGNTATETAAAVGATPPAGPALAPDFSAEKLFFPGQIRTVAAGFDVGNFARAFAPAFVAAFTEAATAAGEMDDEDKARAEGVVAAVRVAFPGSAPAFWTYGMDKGEYTCTMVLPPAFIRSMAALGPLVEALSSGGHPDFDEDDPIWGDDDEDFDEDFDEDDENTYGNPDPADLEDEDFDDDEF